MSLVPRQLDGVTARSERAHVAPRDTPAGDIEGFDAGRLGVGQNELDLEARADNGIG
jgi:hypothetical protein